jgi:hypothetical protein
MTAPRLVLPSKRRARVPAMMGENWCSMLIKRRDADDATRDIARSYNVSHSTISRLNA